MNRCLRGIELRAKTSGLNATDTEARRKKSITLAQVCNLPFFFNITYALRGVVMTFSFATIRKILNIMR